MDREEFRYFFAQMTNVHGRRMAALLNILVIIWTFQRESARTLKKNLGLRPISNYIVVTQNNGREKYAVLDNYLQPFQLVMKRIICILTL